MEDSSSLSLVHVSAFSLLSPMYLIACNSSALSAIYRIVLDTNVIANASNVPVVLGAHKVEVRFAVYDQVIVYIGGQMFANYNNQAIATSQSIIQYVDTGPLMIAFQVQEF